MLLLELGTPNGNFLYCDGSTINRTTYNNLFSAIGITYGSGDGSTTFKIPDFRGMFLRGRGGNAATMGTKQAESLPDISGSWDGYEIGKGPSSGHGQNVTTGAFSVTDGSFSGSDGAGNNNAKLNFKASDSNSIYSGSHVTPVNYAVKFYIAY